MTFKFAGISRSAGASVLTDKHRIYGNIILDKIAVDAAERPHMRQTRVKLRGCPFGCCATRSGPT